jgi:hypothetical protein
MDVGDYLARSAAALEVADRSTRLARPEDRAALLIGIASGYARLAEITAGLRVAEPPY